MPYTSRPGVYDLEYSFTDYAADGLIGRGLWICSR